MTDPLAPRWTPERQCRFLHHLDRHRSVGHAADAVGMSRESAYRLRRRDPHGLFALLWADILRRPPIARVTRRTAECDPREGRFRSGSFPASGSPGGLATRETW